MPHPARAALMILACAIGVGVCAERAATAPIGPTVMMFHGAPLPKPVFITGADTEAFGNLHLRSPIPAGDFANRPFVSAALFWGPPGDPAVNGTRDLARLRPEMAWQHARFYPATAKHPAAFVTTLFSKGNAMRPPTDTAVFIGGGPVPAPAMAVLVRHGIASR